MRMVASSKAVAREVHFTYHNNRETRQIKSRVTVKAPQWPKNLQVLITGNFKDIKNTVTNIKYGVDAKPYTFDIQTNTEEGGNKLTVNAQWNQASAFA